jgi:ferrous-iron efflux pump FieF
MMPTTSSSAETARLLHLATSASVLTAGVLILGKLAAWLLTGSVSLLASLVDSLMDAAASLLNLLAVRYSLKPADAEHRFGHGKAEALAGLAQATFIAGSALFLSLHAVDRLLHPRPLEQIGVGIAVMVFAIAATLGLLAIQRHVIRRTGSTAIRADSLHYVTDLLTNAAILLALGLAHLGWPGFDPVFALGIAGYILYSAWRIGGEAFELLMDRELPEDIQQKIRATALANHEVRGVHELRTRRSGNVTFIQLHLELDDGLDILSAHRICDQVDASIRALIPDSEVLIHKDPASLGNERDAPASK